MGKKKTATPKTIKKGAITTVGTSIPAKYLKPFQETPLLSAFASAQSAGGANAAAVGGVASSVAQFAIASLLNNLGYSSVEEALSVLQAAKREFTQRFGLTSSAVDAFIDRLVPMAKAAPAEVQAAVMSQTYTFGFSLGSAHRSLNGPENLAVIPKIQSPSDANANVPMPIGLGFTPSVGGQAIAAAVGTGATTLPSSVNLISQLPNPIRNQGNRQTCVAHGSLVAYEHYLSIVTGQTTDLSEQFLYWACKRRDGLPVQASEVGTTMTAGADSLENDGVCPESIWPYNPVMTPGNDGQGPTPGLAIPEAAKLRTTHPVIRITATAVDDYKQVLASGRCAAFAVPVYNSNFNPQISSFAATVFSSGRITLPIPGESPIGGHCMCMVGYEDDPTAVPALGGGRFIIRNSYGNLFGGMSPYGPGHGTIPYAYIAALAQDTGIAFL